MKQINELIYVQVDEVLGGKAKRFGNKFKSFYAPQGFAVVNIYDDKQMKLNNNEREVEVHKSITEINHPNILSCFGRVQHSSTFYIFEELSRGGGLDVAATRGISEIRVVELFRQALDALTHLHDQKIIHRDIKPSSFLLDENGCLKLCGFSLARNIDLRMTRGACTPLFAAPEVLRLDNYDQKADVWSLGLTLYQMLMGKQLFAHIKSKKNLMAELESFKNQSTLIEYPPHLHPLWNQITQWMIKYSSSLRESMADMLIKYHKLSRVIEKDLIEKYGYDPADYQDAFRITKPASIYRAKPSSKLIYSLKECQQEELSFEYLIQVRQKLSFTLARSKLINKIHQEMMQFYENQKQVELKYFLVFLSYAENTAGLLNLMEEVKARKIRTQNKYIVPQTFQPYFHKEYEQLMSLFEWKLEQLVKKLQRGLNSICRRLQEALNLIYNPYVQLWKDTLKAIQANSINQDLKKKTIHEVIDETKMGKLFSAGNYQYLYRIVMNLSGVTAGENQFQNWRDSEIRQYAFIRMLGNLDQILIKANSTNDDYLYRWREQMEQKDRVKFMDFIRPINQI